MLESLLSFTEVFLRLLHYLPIQSVFRLQRSAHAFDVFYKENRRKIRATLALRIKLQFSETTIITCSNDFATETLLFQVTLAPFSSFEDADLHKKLSDHVGLFTPPGFGTKFVFAVEPQLDFADAAPLICEFLMGDGLCHFDEIILHSYPDCKSTAVGEALMEWLVEEGATFKALRTIGAHPSEEKLVQLATDLELQEIQLLQDDDSYFEVDEDGKLVSEKFSANFFQQLPCVWKFFAPGADCNIDDSSLEHIEDLNIGSGKTLFSDDAIVAWIKRKMESGRVGNLHFGYERFADLLKQLKKEFYCREFDGGVMLRGESGRWICASTLQNDYNGCQELEVGIHSSYVTSFLNPPTMLSSNNLDVMVWTVIDGGQNCVRLQTPAGGVCLEFRITKNLDDDERFLVERLTEKITLYEEDFLKYVIHIETAEICEDLLASALKTLAKKVSRGNFVGALCSSIRSIDSALGVLSKLQGGFPTGLGLEFLHVRAIDVPSEALLATIVQHFGIKQLFNSKLDENPNDYQPWVLSLKFFDETPTLTSLFLDDGTEPLEHKLGLHDATLSRFEGIIAKRSTSEITVNGLRKWVEKALTEMKRFEQYRIRLGKACSEKWTEDFFKELVSVVPGRVESEEEKTFVATDEDSSRRVLVYVEDDSLALLGVPCYFDDGVVATMKNVFANLF